MEQFRIAILMALSMVVGSMMAAEKQFASPDGNVIVKVSDEGGKPVYQVSLGGTTFLNPTWIVHEHRRPDHRPNHEGLSGGPCQRYLQSEDYQAESGDLRGHRGRVPVRTERSSGARCHLPRQQPRCGFPL